MEHFRVHVTQNDARGPLRASQDSHKKRRWQQQQQPQPLTVFLKSIGNTWYRVDSLAMYGTLKPNLSYVINCSVKSSVKDLGIYSLSSW